MRFQRVLMSVLLVAVVSATGTAVARTAAGTRHSVGGPARPATAGVTAIQTTDAPTIATTSAPVAPRTTGRVLVRLKGAATSGTLASIARGAKTTVGGVRDIHRDRLAWTAPRGRSVESFAKQLAATGKVDYAVPEYVRQLVGYTPPSYVSPNDPAFVSTRTILGYADEAHRILVEKFPLAESWWLRDIRAPQAWAEGYTGSAIVGKYPLRADGPSFKVAVLDSGLYADHEDAGANIVGGVDFFNNEDSNDPPALVRDNDVTPVDPNTMPPTDSLADRQAIASHGTCVAGEIGATIHNGLGAVGVGYDTQVVVHKVMGRFHNGSVGISDGAIVDAILFATDNHAKVISMSLGGYDYSAAIASAIASAHASGVVVVAAKGNDASGRAFYPADNQYVVSVGALDKNQSGVTIPASFTNYYHTNLDIMAPGSFIWGLFKPDLNPNPGFATTGYAAWNGTSMSAPIVAGAIAWLWRAAPALSGSEITDVVLGSAAAKGPTTHFPHGYRELDMYAAYKSLEARFPVLARPDLVDQRITSLGQIPVTWAVPTSPTRNVTYDVSVNGSQFASATAATGALFDWTPGVYTVGSHAHSTYNWDDGTAATTATVEVVPLADGPSSWSTAHAAGTSATWASPAYQRAAAIESTLHDASSTPLAQAIVVVDASTDGANFAPTAIPVAELPNGVYRASVSPDRRTYYRLRFETTGRVEGTISSAVTVSPQVALSIPASKSSVSHTRRLTVTGTMLPAHSTSSRVVKLAITRWNGHRWVSYSSAWTRVTNRGSYSTYSASIKLRRKGGYRLYAFAPADALHAETVAGFKSVLVR